MKYVHYSLGCGPNEDDYVLLSGHIFACYIVDQHLAPSVPEFFHAGSLTLGVQFQRAG